MIRKIEQSLQRWYVIRISDGCVVATAATRRGALQMVYQWAPRCKAMRRSDWRREHPR